MGLRLNPFTGQFDIVGTSGGGGTVTSIATGTGLTGGPITTTGTISLANTAVTPGSYGSASQVGTFTVDAQGRLTAASNTSISISGSAITSGTVAIANGGTGQTTANTALNALLPSQATHSGQFLTTNGTNTSWATVTGFANTALSNLTTTAINTNLILNNTFGVQATGTDTLNKNLISLDNTDTINTGSSNVPMDLFATTFTVATNPNGIIFQDGSEGTAGYVWTSTGTNGEGSWIVSSSGGANVFLSNLSSPTAVNQNLIFNTGAPTFVKTKDETTFPTPVSSQDITVSSGTSDSFNSGDASLASGDITSSGPQTGDVFVKSGNAPNSTSTSGNVEITTGNADGSTGSINLTTGTVAGAGTSGDINLTTGPSNGNITLDASSTITLTSTGVLTLNGSQTTSNSNIYPQTSNTLSIGSNTLPWANISSSIFSIIDPSLLINAASFSGPPGAPVEGYTDIKALMHVGSPSDTGGGTPDKNLLIYIQGDTTNDGAKGGSIILKPGDKTAPGTGAGGDLILATGLGNSGAQGKIKLISGTTPSVGDLWTATNADGSGDWVSGTTSFATIALDNLSSVAINTSLLPGTDAAIDLGSSSNRFRDIFISRDINLYGSTSGNITIEAADTTTSYSIKLPDTQGAASTNLQNDGSGNLSWATAASSTWQSTIAYSTDIFSADSANAPADAISFLSGMPGQTHYLATDDNNGTTGDGTPTPLGILAGSYTGTDAGTTPGASLTLLGGNNHQTGWSFGSSVGGDVNIYAGTAAGSGDGGQVSINGGNATHAGNGNGGPVLITGGSPSGTGVIGVITLTSSYTQLNSPVMILPTAASDAAGASQGWFYYNTVSETLRLHNSTIWVDIGNGATRELDNLTTTAINADLIFGIDVPGTLKTKDKPTGNTAVLTVATGDSNPSTASVSGNMNLVTGSAPFAGSSSGNISIASGTSDNSGNTTLGTGDSTSTSGVVNIISGTGGTASGNITLSPGTASTRGVIRFQDGTEGISGYAWVSTDTNGSGSWQPIPITGATTALDNLASVQINSDLIFGIDVPGVLKTNDKPTGNTTALAISTGDSDPSAGSLSGNLNLFTGAAPFSGSQSGNINIISGASDNSGVVTVGSGDSSGTSGNTVIKTGTGSIQGKIQLQDGSEGTAGYVWTSTDTSGSGEWLDSGLVSKGTGNIGAVSSSATITDAAISTTSKVFVILQTDDATAILKSVVPGSGTATVNVVTTTGSTDFSYIVIN